MVAYMLVRHTAYTINNDVRFTQAVESCFIPEKYKAKIQELGGVYSESYDKISTLENDYNYPPEAKGLLCECKGAFVKFKDYELFVPETRIEESQKNE